ncbi:MAG: hypothetical protein QXZ17_06550 [Nitrososphaerota archaeon]
MVFVHERTVGGFVEFSSALDAVKEAESVIYDVEEGLVGFFEKPFLSLCRLEDVQGYGFNDFHPRPIKR